VTEDSSKLAGAGTARSSLRDVAAATDARQFLRNVGGTIASRGLLVGIGLVTSILLARGLGAAGRGEFAVATAVASIGVQLASVGVHTSSSWSVARDRTQLGPLLSNGLLVSAAVGGLVALMASLVTAAVPSLVPLPTALLVLALASVPVGVANLVGLNLMLGLDRVRAFNVLELGQRVIGAAAIAALVVGGAVSATAAFGSVLAATLIAVLAAFWSLGRTARPLRGPDLPLLRATAAYGLRSYVAALSLFLVLRVDVIIIQLILTDRDVGQYAVAVSLAELAYLVPSTVATLLFPRMASMTDPHERWATARRWAMSIAIGTALVVPVGWLLGEPIIATLYGPDFAGGTGALLWLLPGIVLLSVQTIISHYHYAIGAPSVLVIAPLAGAVINVVLNVTLVPLHGISGAGFASAAAYALMLAISGADFARRRPGRLVAATT
jgi:O-antigen/teichoic acid export membrane protein